MNKVSKVMLKGVVLTALMEFLIDQGKEPSPEQIDAAMQFNAELEELGGAGVAALDKTVEEAFDDLMTAIDTIA